MPVGWRRVVRAVRERGQSEVLGATLLTGIMVILVAMAGLFLFADFGGDEEQLLANIEGDVAAEGITLTHDGGDSFDSEDIAVVLTGDNDRDLVLSDDFNASEGGDGQLAPGDVWRYNSSDDLILGSGRMLVVDESTNTVLFDEGYRVEVVPGGVELRVESFNHSDTQSDEADIFGEGDPNNDDGVRWDYEAFVNFDDDEDPVKNPNEVNISFDSSAPLEHNRTDNDLVAYKPSSNPKPVTVTASVDGFTQSDDVNVDVYEVAELSVSIDSISVNLPSSPSPSSTRSGRAFGARSLGSAIQVPKGGSIDVTFTVSNNEPAPALNETVLFTSNALESDKSSQYSRVEPGEDRTETITLDLKDSLGGSQTVEVEIDGTVQETIDLTFVDSLFRATDLVPNAKQQQTFTFRLDKVLIPTKKITLTPDTPAGQNVYGNANLSVEDGGAGGTASVNSGNLVYEAGASPVPPGTSIKIRATQVNAGNLNSGPYEYELTGPGLSTDKSAKSSIARGSGDSGFARVNATGFDSTGTQEQTLSFKLNSDDIPVDGVPEQVAIDLTDAADSLDMGDATVKNIKNGKIVTTNLDGGSYVVVKLGNKYSPGDTVEVTLKKVRPVSEGEFEVGFSRGANDTASDTFEIEAQQPSPFESVKVTDIVPNANTQHQLVSFTANSSLSAGELPGAGDVIDIRLKAHEAVNEGNGKVGYGNAEVEVFSSQGSIANDIDVKEDLGQATIGYETGSGLSPGETVILRVKDINVARIDGQTDPYEATVSPSDSLPVANTTFGVSRTGDPGDAGLSALSMENLAGTNTQTQVISFEPNSAFESEEVVAIELNDAYVDGGLGLNDVNLLSGNGEILNSDISDDTAFVAYRAPGSGYSGEVQIELQGANPNAAAIGETYTVGVSRGTAGTADATFGVFQPAQFDVTVQDTDDSLFGTQYGSEDGLSVTAEIENTASYADTQTITLDVGGTKTTTDVTLTSGASKNVTLSLGSPSKGNYTANVSSETDYATTDARVFADPPEFVAGLETVSGTAGDTVEVEFRATNLSSSSSTVGGYQVALSFNENTPLLSFESVQSNEWSAPFKNDVGNAVSATDFNPNPAVGKPALTFNFTLLSTGTTSLVFDDDIAGINGENRFNDGSGQEYDVLFLGSNVTATSSSP